MELILKTDSINMMRFIAEWDENLTLVMKRRGDASFDVSIHDFSKMVDLVGVWLRSVKENDSRIRN